MGITEIQIATELANQMYDYLPANPNPYADQSISFPGCAQKVGLGGFWAGGSKKPALSRLLSETLEKSRGKFCPLIVEIVKTSIIYKNNKNSPITREEIERLNKIIQKVGFKIPELWNLQFLESLPREKKDEEKPTANKLELIKNLKEEYIGLLNLEPHKRGYAFQDFLNKFFSAFDLAPKSSFRITGEEIDGSFQIGNHTYLLEAKWHNKQTAQSDLLVFSGKVGGKATWSRGLFISYAGYTPEGLEAFARGKPTNLIGMDGQDLFFILDGKMSLIDALEHKARRAVETTDFFVSVFELANG